MDLPSKPTLADYQRLIEFLAKERGFDHETVPEIFMLFLEESGEFAQATRKSLGMKVDKNSSKSELEQEAADVFWLLINLCNRMNIDLEKAFRDKEKINEKRTWA